MANDGSNAQSETTPRTAGQHAIARLGQALATYRERNARYQDSFSRWGPVFAALFPDGVTIRTADDWNRVTTLGHVVDKLVRYTTHFGAPHEDSIHDLGVYAFILEGIDAEIATRERHGRVLSHEEMVGRAEEKARQAGERS